MIESSRVDLRWICIWVGPTPSALNATKAWRTAATVLLFDRWWSSRLRERERKREDYGTHNGYITH